MIDSIEDFSKHDKEGDEDMGNIDDEDLFNNSKLNIPGSSIDSLDIADRFELTLIRVIPQK